MMYGVQKTLITWLVVLSVILPAGLAMGQVQGVLLEVPRDQLGLSGRARLGAWTPLRISLVNQAAEPRQLVCRWLLNDSDGDRVLAERRVTLDALSTQDAWLYGPLPMQWRQSEPWIVQVLNEEATEELARAEAPPPTLITPAQRMIGIAGTHALGLGAYTTPYTSHEPITLVTGLSLTTMPDRWYGLSAIDTLIWTRNGGEPDDPLVSSATQQALREWVRRGGHLIVLLPAYGQTWTGSGLADLLPVKEDQVRRMEGRPPSWLGAVRSEEVLNVDMNVFDVDPGDGVEVIRRYNNQPIIVAKRFGFGRVTLLGLDLADRRFAQMGLPNGRYPVWNDVFMWQAPVYERARIDAEIDDNKMSRPDQRSRVPLGRFIPGRISMRGAAAPALLAAILLFGLYWFAAGPLSVIVLKKRDATRHSWVVFVIIVLGFSLVSWSGAWVMAPKRAAVSHFTILTAQADSPTVHAHSWLSLYIPKFARQAVVIDPDHPSALNTLSSRGLVTGQDETGFLDPQTYTIDMAAPGSAEIPFRSTAKQLETDYLGRIDQPQAGMNEPLIMPQGTIKVENFWPTGKLSHGLPGPLRDVLMIYCPGENQTPWVWRLKDAWEPKQVLDLSIRPVTERLVLRPHDTTYAKRQWQSEGFLGKLINTKPGQQLIDATGAEVLTSSSEMVKYIQMLCFFDTLPPPDFRKTGFPYAVAFNRSLGRQLDLTPLFAGRRLIVIGHMEDSPLPVPMTVQGEEVSASGWTVVRWVYDLE
jgi:hypothetical protein